MPGAAPCSTARRRRLVRKQVSVVCDLLQSARRRERPVPNLCVNQAGAVFANGRLRHLGTRVGWTIGYGAEFDLGKNWSAKAEYDYIIFRQPHGAGVRRHHDMRDRADISQVKVGLNYRLRARRRSSPSTDRRRRRVRPGQIESLIGRPPQAVARFRLLPQKSRWFISTSQDKVYRRARRNPAPLSAAREFVVR